MSPASGDSNTLVINSDTNLVVSIQLMSPASGDNIIDLNTFLTQAGEFPFN